MERADLSAATGSSSASSHESHRTLITVSGQSGLVQRLTPGLENGLPGEAVEWKRSFGRVAKTVSLSAHFVPFDPSLVHLSGPRSLHGSPVLHTYWIECSDLDTFKANAKDEILQWITMIRKCGIVQDWMVTIVEPADVRKTSKLLARTSVLDKLKQEVGGRTPERCSSLIVVDGCPRFRLQPRYPSKNDARAADSWQSLLHKMRVLALQGYNRILGKFEESMRAERERRNDANWNFCDYFLLQEELAFTYEKLGVYDEALVQYDELDALFTQFILNSNVTESPAWLQILARSCSNWSGLSLNPPVNHALRESIVKQNPSLLDLRNYLFSRQCAMLLKVHNPSEMAKRSLVFLHNCVQEIDILELSFPKGSIACWVLLSCLEILLTYEKYSDASNRIQLYCLHTASLWEYARNKLWELGNLCGLMPNMDPSSEQIHRVVELSSGIRDDHYVNVDRKGRNPIEKLKEALSSKQAFQKYYLELSELAISTYKHIGRIRSARYIGIDLAKFYLLLEQIPLATTFLLDALKTFQGEEWGLLELQTLKEVANCYRKLDEKEKLIRTCAQIAAYKIPENGIKAENNAEVETHDSRASLFNELMSLADANDTMVNVDASPHMLGLVSAQISNSHPDQKVIPGAEVTLGLELTSNFPEELHVDELSVALVHSEPLPITLVLEKEKKKVRKTHSGAKRTLSNSSTSSNGRGSNSNQGAPMLIGGGDQSVDIETHDSNRLVITEQFDHKQDKSLSATRLLCRNAAQVLRRKDSSGLILRDGNIKRSDFTHSFRLRNCILRPGPNCFKLTTEAGPIGRYDLSQLSVRCKKLDLLLPNLKESLPKSFSVISEQPSMSIKTNGNELLSGVRQNVILSISTGSQTIQEGSLLEVTCSRGLEGSQVAKGQKADEELKPTFDIRLPEGKPFEVLHVDMCLMADLAVLISPILVKDSKDQSWIHLGLDHQLSIKNNWTSPEAELAASDCIPLHFSRPLHLSVRLTTSYAKKIVEVTVIGDCPQSTWLEISNPGMTLIGEDVSAISLEPISGGEECYEISKAGSCTFFYNLNLSTQLGPNGPNVLKTRFSMDYCLIDDISGDHLDISRPIQILPDFVDYTTLYILSSRILAAQSAEICRSATICSLILELEEVSPSEHSSIMYEVLADQAVWAVCGRAAAVIDMSSSRTQTISVEVMPLVGGHLALPKVRLSKYLVPKEGKDARDRHDSSMSKLEPFSPGQIFNASRFQRVHVLASASKKKDSTSNEPQLQSLASVSSEMQSLSTRSLLLQSQAVGSGAPISLP